MSQSFLEQSHKPAAVLKYPFPPSPPLSADSESADAECANAEELHPQVANIIKAVRRRHRGHPTSSDEHFPLPCEDFHLLIRRIKEDEEIAGFFEDKVRFDYDPADQEFVLRMPGAIHDFLVALVVARLEAQLRDLRATNPTLLRYLALVRSGTTADHKYFFDNSDIPTKHSPDGQLFRLDARWPCVVFECSYSQHVKKLDSLAYDYLRGGERHTRAVVGLDITYPHKPNNQEATVMVWRRVVAANGRWDTKLTHKGIFCDKKGKACPGTVPFTLGDFIPEAPSPASEIPVNLSYADLRTDLADSEIAMNTYDKAPTPTEDWNPKRKASPEELRAETEAKMRRMEKQEEERASAEDSDYAESNGGPGLPIRRRRSSRLDSYTGDSDHTEVNPRPIRPARRRRSARLAKNSQG